MEGGADNPLPEHGRQRGSRRVESKHPDPRGREHDAHGRVGKERFFQDGCPLKETAHRCEGRLLGAEVDSVGVKDAVVVEIADERSCGGHAAHFATQTTQFTGAAGGGITISPSAHLKVGLSH